MSDDVASRVLVAIDPGKRPLDPLRLGGELAGLLNAPLELTSAFPYLPVLQDPDEEELVAIRAGAREELLALGRELEGVEVADAAVVASAHPARTLQELSERPDARVLVIGSTTRGAVRRVLLGTVGGRLVDGAACPLAIAPHGYGEAPAAAPGVIGVAFDGSDESRHALAAARMLARRSGARLRIITVHQLVAFGGTPLGGPLPDTTVDEAIEAQLREVHRAAVAECAAQDDGPAVEGEFHLGGVAHVLAQRSAELDLLVAGSRGYGPVGAVLLGSTTHELLRGAACPLLLTPRGTQLR